MICFVRPPPPQRSLVVLTLWMVVVSTIVRNNHGSRFGATVVDAAVVTTSIPNENVEPANEQDLHEQTTPPPPPKWGSSSSGQRQFTTRFHNEEQQRRRHNQTTTSPNAAFELVRVCVGGCSPSRARAYFLVARHLERCVSRGSPYTKILRARSGVHVCVGESTGATNAPYSRSENVCTLISS
jgi:hypothetical protein